VLLKVIRSKRVFALCLKLITCCFFLFFQAAAVTSIGSSDLLAVVSISAFPNESVMERKPSQDVVLAIVTIILAGVKDLLLFLRKSTRIGLSMMYALP